MKMKKLKYVTPRIDYIRLDNEISLILESEPPVGPDEVSNNHLNYKSSNPFPDSNC